MHQSLRSLRRWRVRFRDHAARGRKRDRVALFVGSGGDAGTTAATDRPATLPSSHLSLFSQKNSKPLFLPQTTPVAVGVAVGAAAYAAKFAIEAFVRIRSMPKSRNFYKGGFLPEMTRREAALILGLREGAQEARVRDAHRRIMIANHPDAGGSSYLATKVNEAKEMLMGGKGKRSGGGSAF